MSTEDVPVNAQLDPPQSMEPVDAPTESSTTDNVSLLALPHGPTLTEPANNVTQAVLNAQETQPPVLLASPDSC